MEEKQNQLITKKEKNKLNPVIIDNKDLTISNIEDLKDSLKNLKLFDYKQDNKTDMSDNFFRVVIQQLLSDDNISLKTEYLTQNENFAGAKLEFLSKYANMPQLKEFIKIFEIKRVSLGRKSRIELIKAFEKREEEVNAQNRIQSFKEYMGLT